MAEGMAINSYVNQVHFTNILNFDIWFRRAFQFVRYDLFTIEQTPKTRRRMFKRKYVNRWMVWDVLYNSKSKNPEVDTLLLSFYRVHLFPGNPLYCVDSFYPLIGGHNSFSTSATFKIAQVFVKGKKKFFLFFNLFRKYIKNYFPKICIYYAHA